MNPIPEITLETADAIDDISKDARLQTHSEHAVKFDGPEDRANPLNWSPLYKWSIVAVISVMSLVV